ncbi:MAG: hypothetical protein JXB38_21600 [Anaerolineales bacterium]|nr:hypothetical protein [Anaerolineales bacterium]
MLQKLFDLNGRTVLLIYLFVDVICTGMGMGVPFFNIMFGFVIGWYLVGSFKRKNLELGEILRLTFRWGILTPGFTGLMMLVLWVQLMQVLFKPGYDLIETGIPLILYDPLFSFIGWEIWMILLSPFFQFLTTLFSANVFLIVWENGHREEYLAAYCPPHQETPGEDRAGHVSLSECPNDPIIVHPGDRLPRRLRPSQEAMMPI